MGRSELALTLFLCSLTLACGAGAAEGGEAPTPAAAAETPGPFAESTQQYDFANGLLRRGLYPEAAEIYTKFLKTFPDDNRVALALLWRGEAQFRLHRYREAARDFYGFLTKYPEHEKGVLARLRYGCCLFELGRYEHAVASLEPLITDKIKDEDVRRNANYYLGLSRFALKRYPQALTALAAVEKGPLAAEALFARGEVLAAQRSHVAAADVFAAFVKRYPDHARRAEALLRQGEELRVAGKLEAAAKCFVPLSESGALSPARRAQARYGLAWVRYAQEDYASTRALVLKVIEAKEESLRDEAQYLLGLAALQLKDPVAAEAAFGRVKAGSFQEDAVRKRAWALLAAGKTDEALGAVEAYSKAYPKGDRCEMDYIAGKAFAKRGAWEQAIARFRAVREAKRAYYSQAAYDLAFAYDTLKRYDEAARAYGYFVKSFPNEKRVLDALVGQGQALMNAERYEAAIPVYVRLLSEEQVTAVLREHALHQEAVAYYWLKQYANMRKCYEQLLSGFPKGRSAPEAMYWLAWYESSEKRYRKAAERYAALIKAFPMHVLVVRARYRRARCLYLAGEERQAADALHEILTKYPKTPVDQKEILWAGQYLMKQGELTRAYEVYDLLLKRQPGRKVRALALYYQAEVKRQRGEWKEALTKYQRLLIEKDTGLESAARFGLAVCYRELGMIEAARKALSQVKLSNDDPLVAQYIYETGLLDLAETKLESAADHLMRVALVYDEEELCGRALLHAYEACRLGREERKARICLDELTGGAPGTYGVRYPKSMFTAEGKRLRQALLEKQGLVPAKIPGDVPPRGPELE